MPHRTKDIESVLEAHVQRLMSLPGVAGAGIGIHENEQCIMIFIERNSTELLTVLPGELDGYYVSVMTSGSVKALR